MKTTNLRVKKAGRLRIAVVVSCMIILLAFRVEYEPEGPDVTLVFANTYSITAAWDGGLNLWIYKGKEFIARYPKIEVDPIQQVPENLEITMGDLNVCRYFA